MNSYVIDTHSAIKKLEAVGFPPEQAEVVTSLFSSREAELATKSDLRLLKGELKTDIAELRTELKGDISELRTELKTDIAELRAEFKSEIAELRTELKDDIAELRAEFKSDITELRTELKGDITELRTELKGDIAELKGDISGLNAGHAVLQEQIKSIRIQNGVVLAVTLAMLAMLIPVFLQLFVSP